ncbi:MAG: PAS domain-containing protein [Candidatus Scalindua sp.]|nr:PAS domain-containing protein [Candidatus Scalindua sp.]
MSNAILSTKEKVKNQKELSMNNAILSTEERVKNQGVKQDVATKATKKGWFEYESSYDGVLLNIDIEGARLLGFTSPDEVIGKKINELYAHPYDHEKTLSMLIRDGKVNVFFTLMKGREDKLFYIKQNSKLIVDDHYYHLPSKVQSSFEFFQYI